MATPIEIVEAFIAGCGESKDAMVEAYRRYFTPTTIWDNVGMAKTTGPEEAIALMDAFEANMGMATFHVEMLSIAAQGNKVLTERIDILRKADGSDAMTLHVMGIFEVEGGKITAWRDYFDTAGVANGIYAH
jgi:limonene-1,2-epoxide hydrolase